jgi:toxin ParE1/3/4
VTVARLAPEATAELVEAALWYQAQRPGLESEFLDEVDRVLPLIESSPESFPRLLDMPADLVIRRARLPRFPYALVFMDLGEQVRILAVAHAKRRPGYWLDRVRQE